MLVINALAAPTLYIMFLKEITYSAVNLLEKQKTTNKQKKTYYKARGYCFPGNDRPSTSNYAIHVNRAWSLSHGKQALWVSNAFHFTSLHLTPDTERTLLVNHLVSAPCLILVLPRRRLLSFHYSKESFVIPIYSNINRTISSRATLTVLSHESRMVKIHLLCK